MDDPWANAWGEPATTSKLPRAPVFPAAHTGDDEEDITIPAWEPQPSWSDGNNSNSLWGARSPALDKFPSWHSPYDDLPLGKSSSTSLPEAADVQEATNEDEEEAPEPESEPEPSLESLPEPEPAFQSVRQSPVESSFEPTFEPPVASPVLPPNSPPGSPDAFGTFETGLDNLPSASDPWAPSHGASVPDSADSAWGAAWEPSDVQKREDEVPAVVDEWEAAKQQKALQDKHVPPELLAALLVQFTEFADDLCPPQPTPNLDPDDYRASRHKGLQGVDSLNPTIMRLMPTDLTLPPPRPFQKSITAKHTTDALRLSRSAGFVRFSPLSHYGATKGSTAWEASVKSRPEVVAEPDLLPPGWRIVETKKDAPVTDKKKTGHGGLLSFFGRRTSTPPVVGGEGAIPRSSSPASTSSPRASLDSSAKSPTSSTKSPTTKSPTTTTTSAATSAAPSALVSPTTSISSAPPPLPVVPVVSQTDPAAAAEPDPVAPVAAPSAVSRFLGRFGRKAPDVGRRQSLALSEGDFDFLDDIDGSATGSSVSSGSDFAISGVLLDDPVPLPAKLAPPPPAPRVPVQNPITAAPHTGHEGRPSGDPNRDELAIFGTFTPPAVRPFTPPLAKPFAPPLAQTSSAPTPTPIPVPSSMSPVDSDVDFSAWGFDEEDKSSGMARTESESVGIARPPPRQTFNTRAATNARGTAPPPRRVIAIMSSGSSKPPSAIPKLDGSFGFLPPPRAAPTVAPMLAPPPGTRPLVKPKALLDDDDFSDFHAPAPAQITPAASSNSFYDTSFSSSTSSERGLFSSTSSSTSVPTNLFDDFDDFLQASPHEPTTLRTPSPPRPPAKSPRILAPSPAPLSFGASDDISDDTPLALTRSSLQQQRAAASHQRALSLVESAAASSGVRWPAPESPLPEALEPPPDASDPFGFNTKSTMQSQQAAFLQTAPPPALKASFSAPPPPAPVPIRALSPPVLSPPPQPQKTPTPTPMARFPPPPGSAPMRAFSPPVPSPVQKAASAATPIARFPPPPGSAPMRAFSPPVPSPPMQKAASAAPTARFPPPPGSRAFSPPAPSRTPTLLPPPQNGALSPPMLTSQRQAPAVPTPPPMTSAGSGKPSGGLSASDLSFFEGL
ncbi:hypothetical protein K438DRAFT_2016690 [Mycena galopus ATCC 62051]|nr:hypothetical protein K438DRAFT_2016690 [Mycena galopus ATCC 62051]